MSQTRYTIVIENGELAGVSQHDGNLDAVPLSLDEFAKLLPDINAAAITKAESLEAAHAAALAIAADELAGLQLLVSNAFAAKDKILAAAQDPETDLNAVAATIIAEAEKPEVDKIRAEKLAQYESLKLELGIPNQ